MQHKPGKKDIQSEAARLRKTPGWDPKRRATEDPMASLRRLDQELQNQRTYEQSEICEHCQKARVEADDPSALCEKHLQEALGF